MPKKNSNRSLSTSISLWARRHRWLSAVTALALLATGLGIGLGGRSNNDRLVTSAGSGQSSSGGTSPTTTTDADSTGTPSASAPSGSTTTSSTPSASATASGGAADQPSSTTSSGTSGGSALSGGSSPSSLLGSGTAFGASLDLANGGGFSQALSQQDNRFGRLGIVRVFYQGLPASWASHPELATRPSIISFKIQPSAVLNGSYDSQLLAWFAAAPRTTDVFWSYWHEPENDKQLNLADYRAAWQHISSLSRRASNPHLHATLILMGYTSHPGSGRDWHNYYPGSASIDVMGWDAYNSGNKKGIYTDPATLFDPVAAVSRQAGKPWGIAETASKVLAPDGGTQGRADWLRATSSYLSSHGALFCTYWDVNASGGSFKLTDQPSISAWRAAVAESA